jgi:hypothetical protein
MRNNIIILGIFIACMALAAYADSTESSVNILGNYGDTCFSNESCTTGCCINQTCVYCIRTFNGTIFNPQNSTVASAVYLYNSNGTLMDTDDENFSFTLNDTEHDIVVNPTSVSGCDVITVQGITKKDDFSGNFLGVANTPENASSAKTFQELCAVYPMLNSSDYSNLVVSLTHSSASNWAVYKCDNWDFTADNCTDESWTEVANITNGATRTNVSFTAFTSGIGLGIASKCGDGTCGSGENCASCSADCGTCPSTPSGGGGGGGGTRTIVIEGEAPAAGAEEEEEEEGIDFTIFDPIIKVKVKQGEKEKYRLEIFNSWTEKIKLEMKLDDNLDFIKIEGNEKKYTTFIEKGAAQVIELEFAPDFEIEPEIYLTKLEIKGKGTIKDIPIIVEVQSGGESLFDVDLEILPDYYRVAPGTKVVGEIRLFNLGSTSRIDTVVTYSIKDFDGNVINSEHETLAVETQASFVRELNVPRYVNPGTYVYAVKAEYEGKIATTSQPFEVVGSSITGMAVISFLKGNSILGYIILALLILYFWYRSNISVKDTLHNVKNKFGGIIERKEKTKEEGEVQEVKVQKYYDSTEPVEEGARQRQIDNSLNSYLKGETPQKEDYKLIPVPKKKRKTHKKKNTKHKKTKRTKRKKRK